VPTPPGAKALASAHLSRRSGHEFVHRPTPAPHNKITAQAPEFASLAGISLTVTLTAKSESTKTRSTLGGFLFTHGGYSDRRRSTSHMCCVRAA